MALPVLRRKSLSACEAENNASGNHPNFKIWDEGKGRKVTETPIHEVMICEGIVAGGAKPLFVVGPCVIESEEHCRGIALQLASWARSSRIQVIFKASFDKANRTSVTSYRGPGLVEGLRILAAVKRETGLPILTDIHDPSQAESAAQVADVLQIPAFLCRQTDLLVAAGRTGRVVNIKKGQFLSPWDMAHAVEKVASAGCDRILLTERGASFGYNNLVVDMRSITVMRSLGWPVIFDATHSVQLPGAGGGKSSGQREFVPTLAQAAAGAGADGFFFEVHESPVCALSDGPNALPLTEFPVLARRLISIFSTVRETP
jgi:2-dehydro-3-deoxyphosphooctonate aldolase (KDO 8-P synthase)